MYKSGEWISGVYTIDPDGSGAFDVFCDQTTSRGGWTVFQKRLDGSVDFYRGWKDYKLGFGNLNGEFWLGLDKIHRLTNTGRYKLRVDLEDIQGNTAYAEYDMFAVTSERTKYQLSLGTYSGEHSLNWFHFPDNSASYIINNSIQSWRDLPVQPDFGRLHNIFSVLAKATSANSLKLVLKFMS